MPVPKPSRPYRSRLDRCLYREARRRYVGHLAEHRSVTIGRAGTRRPSLAAKAFDHDAA